MLTGLPAGEPDTTGVYPQGTLHRAVADCRAQYAATLRDLNAEEKKPELIPV